MKRLLALVASLALIALPALGQSNVRIINNANLTWTRTTFALNGSSQTLLAATSSGASARSGFVVVNPAGNATVYLSIAGGTATSADLPIAAGTWVNLTGGIGPFNVVTVLGTNAQNLTIYTGN